ncbi:MAG: hypothetical protein KDA41_22855, partial [Planctomycetales bacterium]|nr:hypothetical protein [Planctomycetales bacterium]
MIGNPPYRGVSASEHEWIARLLQGIGPAGEERASYYHVDGRPLGERKHWLRDDYVKFLRLAQYHVERCGAGAVAMVLNRGFLDNPTFRGMRAGLMQTFSQIDVVDLGGNIKSGHAPREDESVFATAQGMSLLIARRGRNDNGAAPTVRHAVLQGARADKLRRLEPDQPPLDLAPVEPQPPLYLFCPHDAARDDEYAAGFRLPEIMPVNSTAVVTARDKAVIAFDRAELESRLAEFADPLVADDALRAKYFARQRSVKYAAGDTRGWKLTAARAKLQALPDRAALVQTCLYRPFDERPIAWAPWLIDWPREEVARHFQRPNLALVCRRQMLR